MWIIQLIVIISLINLGYKANSGLASVCVHTVSIIYSTIGDSDIRFNKAIDDPKGDETNTAKKVLAVPIIESQEDGKHAFALPKGVIVIVNKKDNGEFDSDDIDNIKSYCTLVSKALEFNE